MLNHYAHIGEVISHLRLQRGLTQIQLSDGICSREYLIKLEKQKASPTTEMVNLFGDRLGVDIYEEYSLILRHGGFDRHHMITEFNECYNLNNMHRLPALIEKCQQQFPNCDGELYQHLCYARAICQMDINKNPLQAREYALQGITYKLPLYNMSYSYTEFYLRY